MSVASAVNVRYDRIFRLFLQVNFNVFLSHVNPLFRLGLLAAHLFDYISIKVNYEYVLPHS